MLAVPPATSQSRLAFWVPDADQEIAGAETAQEDRIVVFSHPESERDDREDKGIAEVEQRRGIPVTHAEIGR